MIGKQSLVRGLVNVALLLLMVGLPVVLASPTSAEPTPRATGAAAPDAALRKATPAPGLILNSGDSSDIELWSSAALERSFPVANPPAQLWRGSAFSPDGGAIAYAVRSAGFNIISILSSDGTTTPVATFPVEIIESINSIAWTPDGLSLVYGWYAYNDGSDDVGISRVSIATGESTPVLAPTSFGIVRDLAVSHDGATIAFERGDTILTVASSGGESVMLSTTTCSCEEVEYHGVDWSTDDSRILTVRKELDESEDLTQSLIQTISQGTDPVTLLTVSANPFNGNPTESLEFSPRFSTDNSQVMFTHAYAPISQVENKVEILTVGTGDVVQLPIDLEFISDWQPCPAGTCVSWTGEVPATAPQSPTSVVATGGNAEATVSWMAPGSDGGSALTGYTVTSSPGGFTKTIGPGVTSTTLTGLANGTAYTFTVKATNAVGGSPASSPSNSVTPVAPAVTPPGPSPACVVAQADLSSAQGTLERAQDKLTVAKKKLKEAKSAPMSVRAEKVKKAKAKVAAAKKKVKTAKNAVATAQTSVASAC